MQISFNHRTLKLNTPAVMGILNVTPDSFSDGGKFIDKNKAFAHAVKMVKEGADIIDIGGESTRPGAAYVSEDEEASRVIPIVSKIAAELDVMISVDTSRPAIIQECVKEGAHIWNDIRALTEPNALECAAKLQIPVCLMHMQGTPSTMQNNPSYKNVVEEVKDFLLQRAEICLKAGIKENNIILDPGFGFGKSVDDNYLLLKHLDVLCACPYPILSALSRKSMLGAVLNEPVASLRDNASVSGAVISVMKGAKIVRVHNVKATKDAILIASKVLNTD